MKINYIKQHIKAEILQVLLIIQTNNTKGALPEKYYKRQAERDIKWQVKHDVYL